MQIDRRFADYGLTGGFYIICHLGILLPLGFWPTNILDNLKDYGFKSETLSTPIITGFAGALAVIAVFVAGLILDLLASIVRGQEMRIFARHLDLNSEWITEFLEAHKAYCSRDYETFRREIRELPTPRDGLMRIFTYEAWKFWKREERRRNLKIAKINWGFGVAPEYERLLSFFTTYVMGQCGPAQLTLIADQYSLWRTARAIAVAIFLLAFEAAVIFSASVVASIVFVAAWTMFGITYFLIRGPYSRLCFTLFALLYILCEKQIGPQKNAGSPAP